MYDKLADKETVQKVIVALKERGVEGIYVENGTEALEKIKELIPTGASVMNGTSTTLEQIGYLEYLESGKHGWNNLHAGVIAENDKKKRGELRKWAALSDYYLGSVHALAESGEFIVGSNTGSQLPHIVFTSPNLIFVVSTKKIVKNFQDAMERLKKHVVPLEDKRSMKAYGVGTALNKIVIFNGENPGLGRKVRMILVNEDLGF